MATGIRHLQSLDRDSSSWCAVMCDAAFACSGCACVCNKQAFGAVCVQIVCVCVCDETHAACLMHVVVRAGCMQEDTVFGESAARVPGTLAVCLCSGMCISALFVCVLCVVVHGVCLHVITTA